MLPTGLGILAVSKKALEAHKTCEAWSAATSRFEDMIKRQRRRLLPLHAGDAAAARPARLARPAAEEGLDNVFARHHRLAEGVRKARRGLGPEAVRQGAEVALRHGQRHPRSAKASTAPGRQDAPTSATTSRSASASTRSPARCSASAISARSNEIMVGGVAVRRRKWRCATAASTLVAGLGQSARRSSISVRRPRPPQRAVRSRS